MDQRTLDFLDQQFPLQGKKPETVDHPLHYGGDTPYEVIKVLRNWFSPEQYEGFLVGNAIKYLARYKKKNGVEDISKAIWYAKCLREHLGGDK